MAELSLFANVFTFIIFTIVTAIILYFGKTTYPKKIPRSWFIFASSFQIYAFAILFEIFSIGNTIGKTLLQFIAGIQIILGLILVLTQERRELLILRRRQDDIRALMEKLKEKFLRRQIMEEDVRKLYSTLQMELAEIELKLEKKKAG